MSDRSHDQFTPAEARGAWLDWALRVMDGDARAAEHAARAAWHAVEAGASSPVAAVIGRMTSLRPTEAELATVSEELNRIRHTRQELDRLTPGQVVEAAELDQLRAHYARLEGLLSSASERWQSLTGPDRTGPLDRAPSGDVHPPVSNAASLEVASQTAVALLALTALFALYPAIRMPGWLRPSGAIAVGLCLAVAGGICLRRPRLRRVGQTFLAVASLVIPVTCASGYLFLSVDLPPGLFILTASAACAILYGALALRLGPRPYGALSLLALSLGWMAAAAALHLGPWSGPAMLPLGWGLLGLASKRAPALVRRVYTPWWEPAFHLWALLTGLVTLVTPPADPAHGWAVATAFLGVGTTYAVYLWVSQRGWMSWAPVTGLCLAVLGLNDALRLGQTGVAFELVTLAVLCLAAAQLAQPARRVLRRTAAVLLALCALLAAELAWAQAAALLAATGLVTLLALQSRRPAWLVLAAGIFTIAYYWLAQPILPPASFATPTVMVALYAPLPVAMTAAASIVRGIAGRRWAVPLYVWAGLLALSVGVIAFRAGDLGSLARILLIYGGVLYLVATVERSIIAAGSALVALGLAIACILATQDLPPAAYVLSGSAFGVAVYLAHLAWWPAPRLDELHRLAGLGASGLAALACFLLLPVWHNWSWAPLVALGSLLVFAALLAAESRQYERRFLLYPMAIALSLGAPWIASYLGATDPLWFATVPAATIVVLAARAPHDPWLPRYSIAYFRAGATFGCALLLGPGVYESIASPTPLPHTGLLALEACAALLAGIHAGNRAVAVSGMVGLALGALRTIALLTQALPPMALVGLLAVFLFAMGSVLVLFHGRLGRARSSLARSWQQWT